MALWGKSILNGLGSFLLAHAPQRQTGNADPLGDLFAGGEQQKATRRQQQYQEKQKGEKGTFAL